MRTFFFVLLFIFPFCSSFSQEKNTDTTLLIIGTFSLKNNLARNINANLYLNDKRIDSLVVSGNQEFGFYLKRNSKYIIEILKEGFIRKTILVSTDLPDDIKIKPKGYFNFGVQVPLVHKPEEDDNQLVKYVDDFPIGYIFYNEKIKIFDYSKDYSRLLKEKQQKAREEAKAKSK